MATATLDTGVLGARAAMIAMTTEKMVTLYVIPKSGSHKNHRVTIEFSPDGGTTWVPSSESVNGTANSITVEVVATHVRACVCEAENEASNVTVHMIAR